ncbi:hypothetical protein KP002_13940 [Geomonas subterranea]|uniref:hypothetical protein n=1 Tax=Geomonas subterranea TaxID=2847989 RepID=UPI001C4581BD|nr:hypothetical protein [Geomonas subterranea]QXM08090.1 hypothetical protein KP002_13940 [Geomonas subterranea]
MWQKRPWRSAQGLSLCKEEKVAAGTAHASSRCGHIKAPGRFRLRLRAVLLQHFAQRLEVHRLGDHLGHPARQEALLGFTHDMSGEGEDRDLAVGGVLRQLPDGLRRAQPVYSQVLLPIAETVIIQKGPGWGWHRAIPSSPGTAAAFCFYISWVFPPPKELLFSDMLLLFKLVRFNTITEVPTWRKKTTLAQTTNPRFAHWAS